MYVKIVVVSLLVLFLQHFVRVLYMMGYHTTVYNHRPGPCKFIPGIEHGSEDIEALPNGLAFISTGLMMPTFSDDAQQYYEDHNVKGRILLFDFNSPEKDTIELKFSEGFDESNFMPHGISIYQSPDTGKVYLFVVNHPSGMDRIEKFEYIEKTQTLEHLHSYVDEAINLANDVAATSENSFYFTNYANFRDHYRHTMEALMFLPFGTVWYYNGKDYMMVADGFVLPNGITLSKDYQYVYAASGLFSLLNVFKREDDNSLTLEQEFPLYSMPDNINIEPTSGNLIIAAHPVCHRVIDHMNDPEMPAPSQVLLVNMKNGSHADSITELFSDDGSGGLWAATAGYIYKNKMLIGTILNKLMYCEVRSL